jgi:predicted RNase H-like nuclease
VFPAPPRPLLGERDYTRALATKRALDGTGLSRQAFFLLPKIAEVDAVLVPAMQHQVVEAHPELGFARLDGGPLGSSKRTAEGAAERRGLLRAQLGPLPDRVPGAEPHDLLDAAVLVLTAQRLAEGTAERLGDGSCDGRGLTMEIAW